MTDDDDKKLTELEERLRRTYPTIIGRSDSDAACFDPITTRQQKTNPRRLAFLLSDQRPEGILCGAGDGNRTHGTSLGSLGITIIRRPLWAGGCILSAVAARFNPRRAGDIVRRGKEGGQVRGFR